MNAIQLFAVTGSAVIIVLLCLFCLHHTKDILTEPNRTVSRLGLGGLLAAMLLVAYGAL